MLLDMISGGVVDQLETPRWILLLICVVGVALAFVTDEEYSLLTGDEGKTKLKKSAAVMGASLGTTLGTTIGSNEQTRDGQLKATLNFLTPTSISLKGVLPETVTDMVDKMVQALRRNWSKYQLYREMLALKKKAKTKRQFVYMLEKQALGAPIHDDEDVIDSYLDCKKYLGQKWPFSWQVDKVRQTTIQCAGYDCIPMSSYSYLDLIRDDRVQEAALEAAKKWSTGNHGPRMLGGNTVILCELEEQIAKFFQREATLLCATGYLACMSACAAISAENAVVFADSRCHASLQAGFKLGEGQLVLFRHNNFVVCEEKIRQYRHKYDEAWMVVESVYSMDGDICDLPSAYRLCQKYNIKLVIDEAHGLGVVGKTGRGLEEHFGMQGCATLICGTFSKSIASIGGYITGSQRFISYLDFHAPGNVFSAPLPAYCAGAAMKSFEIIDQEPQLVTKVQQNAEELREKLRTGNGHWPAGYPERSKFLVEGEVSAVVPVVFPDDLPRAIDVASALKKKGFMVSAVAYPACPMRRPRFRITATSSYTTEMIDSFVKELVQTCVECPPSEFAQIL